MPPSHSIHSTTGELSRGVTECRGYWAYSLHPTITCPSIGTRETVPLTVLRFGEDFDNFRDYVTITAPYDCEIVLMYQCVTNTLHFYNGKIIGKLF